MDQHRGRKPPSVAATSFTGPSDTREKSAKEKKRKKEKAKKKKRNKEKRTAIDSDDSSDRS
jgi:hypothetical protein